MYTCIHTYIHTYTDKQVHWGSDTQAWTGDRLKVLHPAIAASAKKCKLNLELLCQGKICQRRSESGKDQLGTRHTALTKSLYNR